MKTNLLCNSFAPIRALYKITVLLATFFAVLLIDQQPASGEPSGLVTAVSASSDYAAALSLSAVNNSFEEKALQEFTAKAHFKISTTVNGSGSVTLNPDKPNFEEGALVTLTARPDTYWSFENWEGDVNGTANPVTMTMDADKSVTANFLAIQWQLTLLTDGTPGATVTPSGTSTVDEGTATAITATPPSGYVFVNWTVTTGSGNASIADAGSASTTVTLTGGDATVTANFVATRQLTLQTDATAGASVTPNGSTTVNDGAATSISATAPAGFSFVNWTVTSGAGNATIANASSASTTVTLSGGDATLQANFAQITRQLTLQTDATAGARLHPMAALRSMMARPHRSAPQPRQDSALSTGP